ncbi:MAG: GNAT family N-acetyltransferase [Nitrosopumilus sp.]
MIRIANNLDKFTVLKFCKDTFSWGDYVDKVWDFWLSEGNLFLFEQEKPIGICHAFYSKDQVWIEGIRIDPSFRRQKIASKLINHAESLGKLKNTLFSFMLIDTKNLSSLSMAHSIGYDVSQTWNFYSLDPQRNSNYNIQFEKSLDTQRYPHYVRSWRWLPITGITLSQFYKQNKIVRSNTNEKNSIAILTDSEHFDKTLIVTLFSNSRNSVYEIISFLQNYGIENKYERIQILTKEKLPFFNLLNYRISFHLMKKSLS